MIHLDLQPDIEARLSAEAQSFGLTVNRYVQHIVATHVIDPEELQLQQDLDQGLREIAAGNTLDARAVFAQVRNEYDIKG